MKRIASLSYALLVAAAAFAGHAQARPSMSILGDSYSTYEGYLSPATNAPWYMAEPQRDLTDVDDVTQTWWHIFATEHGYRIDRNNSYGGTTICNTGYWGDDYSDRSFVARMDDLGSPDLIFIFGATNDSWAGSPIGEFTWQRPTAEQLKEFRPALAYMLDHVVKRYPNTQIVFIINDGLKPEITSSIVEACDHYGVKYVQLEGITKTDNHPDRAGMRRIADQIAEAMGLKS